MRKVCSSRKLVHSTYARLSFSSIRLFFRHTSDRFYVISFESLVGLLYDKCLDTSLIFCNNTFLRNQENTDVCNFLDGFLLQTKLICLEKSLFFLLLLCICHFVCLYSATCNYLCSQTACHRK